MLVASVHRNPDVAVHPVPPHKQAAVFDVAPLVCVQLGAVMHRQKEECRLEHDIVDVDIVLYLRKPLEPNKHPGG